MSEWISVNERLPEENEKVFCKIDRICLSKDKFVLEELKNDKVLYSTYNYFEFIHNGLGSFYSFIMNDIDVDVEDKYQWLACPRRGEGIDFSKYPDSEYFICDDYDHDKYVITHWMPLPDAPKELSND